MCSAAAAALSLQLNRGKVFAARAYLDLARFDVQLNQLLDNCHKLGCQLAGLRGIVVLCKVHSAAQHSTVQHRGNAANTLSYQESKYGKAEGPPWD